MTLVGIDPLVAHLFVFYFATISVITPPVCVAVFVGAGIAQTNWLPAAGEAVRLAAVTYLVPFMLLLYPGLTAQGGVLAILEASITGVLVIFAVAGLLSGYQITRNRIVSICLQCIALALALWPNPILLPLSAAILFLPKMLFKTSTNTKVTQ